jgi:hypothetical protein
MTPIDIENIVNYHFNTLYKNGESIELKFDHVVKEYIRVSIMDKGRVLLIELNNLNSPYTSDLFRNEKISKIKIEELELVTNKNSKELKKYISISCKNGKLFSIFSRLLADILWHLLYDDRFNKLKDPWPFIIERLVGWKLLFSSENMKNEEKGLIGELILLKMLIKEKKQKIKIWDGPLNGVKDFRLDNMDIEVKTTAIRYGYTIHISGFFQAQSQKKIDYLFFVRIEEANNGNINLKQLIDEIKTICSASEKREFIDRLEAFSSELLESSNKWNLLENVFIKIDENFPKITEQSFIGNKLPNGINKISWESDLSNLPKLSIDDVL